MAEKRVKVVGEVAMDAAQTSAVLTEILGELKEWRSQMAATQKEVAKTETAVKDLGQTTKAMIDTPDVKRFKDAWMDSAKEIDALKNHFRLARAEMAATGKAADMGPLRAELVRVADGVNKTRLALGGIANEQKRAALSPELDKLKVAWSEIHGTIEKTDREIRNVNKSTGEQGKLAKLAENAWTGIWQGIGQQAVQILKNAITGLWREFLVATGRAEDFEKVLSRMRVRGVKDVDALGESIDTMADALGVLRETAAEATDFAEQMGAGAESIRTAAAALAAYRSSGVDWQESIRQSAKIVKGFNLDWERQAEVIAAVSEASKKYKIDAQQLFNSMASVGPIINQLNGSFEDFNAITTTALAMGIKSEETGVNGFYEALNQLIKPSEALSRAMLQNGLIMTQNGAAWLAEKSAVEALTIEYQKLTNEVNVYERQREELGMITNEAQRQIEKYEALAQKQEAGERLTRQERQAKHELTKVLEGYNRELAKYDEAAGIEANVNFRRMSVLDELKTRMSAAAELQIDLGEKSARLKFEADGLAETLSSHESTLDVLTQKLSIEIPAAVAEAIGERGLQGFFKEIAAEREVLQEFTAMSQALISTVAPNLDTIGATAGNTKQALTDMMAQHATSLTEAANQADLAQTRMQNTMTRIASAAAKAKMDVAKEINGMLSDEDIKTLEERSQRAAEAVVRPFADLGKRIVNDLKMSLSGEMTFGEIIEQWIYDAMMSDDWGSPIDSLMARIARAMVNALVSYLKQLWSDVANLVSSKISELMNSAKSSIDSVFSFFPSMPVSYPNMPAIVPASVPTAQMAGGGVAAPSLNNNFVINGALDPRAVANEVGRALDEQKLMGIGGGRLY